MKLAAVGSNCIDFYENLEGGKACPGGGPVNMAVYTLRLGGEASYIGPVGRDAYGLFLRNCLKSKGVDVSHMEEKEGETAVSKVYLISGERVFGDYNEGVLSSYQLSNDDLDFISEHDMVVCDLWGKVGYQFKEIKDRGVRTAFDCAERPDDAACKDAIPYTDYLFFSDDEHVDDYVKDKMKELKEKGPKLVICMRGIKGSLCFDGKAYYKYGIVARENVLDTMGAGDSYIAGFLSALGQRKSILECMELGARCASETIGYFGAW